MIAHHVETVFKQQICESVQLSSDGTERYRISVPFMFNDGDLLVIVMKKVGGRWVFSDEGHTYMHLSYSLAEDLVQQGTRRKIITQTLRMFQVHEREGELFLPIEDDQYGDTLWSFTQALLKIIDVAYLSREYVRSTFLEDFEAFLEEMIAPERRTFQWYDAQHDPEKRYVVDCRVNGLPRPLFIYALTNDDRVRDATIGISHFERERLDFYSVGIFEDQTEINRRVLARFTDVCDQQFPSLSTSRDRIATFFHNTLSGSLPSRRLEIPEQNEAQDSQQNLLSFEEKKTPLR